MWRYGQIPESLRLPACPECTNRLRVVMVLRCVFRCGDCGAAFTATWVADEQSSLADEPPVRRAS